MTKPKDSLKERGGDKFPTPSLLNWYKNNYRDLPWRKQITPYRVWLAEMMLQQTRVGNVIPYYKRFIRKFPNLKFLSKAKESEVLELWSGLGYYQRARNILRTAKILAQKHQGKFPMNLDSLKQLPGIGNYTAGAILSIAYDLPFPILDGNVRRVLSRFFVERSQKRLWKISEALVTRTKEQGYHPRVSHTPRDLNQALMELGALICLPLKPLCHSCPLFSGCQARQKGLQSVFPATQKKTKRVSKYFVAAILKNGGSQGSVPKGLSLPTKESFKGREAVLIRQRSKKENWLSGLWELPSIRVSIPSPQSRLRGLSALFSRELSSAVKIRSYLGEFTHSITHHRLRIKVFEGVVQNFHIQNGSYRWISLNKVRKVAASSMLQKSIALLNPN